MPRTEAPLGRLAPAALVLLASLAVATPAAGHAATASKASKKSSSKKRAAKKRKPAKARGGDLVLDRQKKSRVVSVRAPEQGHLTIARIPWHLNLIRAAPGRRGAGRRSGDVDVRRRGKTPKGVRLVTVVPKRSRSQKTPTYLIVYRPKTKTTKKKTRKKSRKKKTTKKKSRKKKGRKRTRRRARRSVSARASARTRAHVELSWPDRSPGRIVELDVNISAGTPKFFPRAYCDELRKSEYYADMAIGSSQSMRERYARFFHGIDVLVPSGKQASAPKGLSSQAAFVDALTQDPLGVVCGKTAGVVTADLLDNDKIDLSHQTGLPGSKSRTPYGNAQPVIGVEGEGETGGSPQQPGGGGSQPGGGGSQPGGGGSQPGGGGSQPGPEPNPDALPSQDCPGPVSTRACWTQLSSNRVWVFWEHGSGSNPGEIAKVVADGPVSTGWSEGPVYLPYHWGCSESEGVGSLTCTANPTSPHFQTGTRYGVSFDHTTSFAVEALFTVDWYTSLLAPWGTVTATYVSP